MTGRVEAGTNSVERDPILAFADDLNQAWRRYLELFGVVPHGTAKQLAALLELTDVKNLLAQRRELLDALRAVVRIADEALGEWDSDNDSRVGKILKALAGHQSGYRFDIDAIHAAIKKAEGK